LTLRLDQPLAKYMPLYKITKDRLESVKETSFAEEKLFERRDLQRLLKADVTVLGDDLMVIAEEFGDWDESSRRIDLLCLDKQSRLVVVEVKRTEDGGHMELQAIRYAAMVSSMTLDQAIAAYARSMAGQDAEVNARREILEFASSWYRLTSPPKLRPPSSGSIVMASTLPACGLNPTE
jgi:RecB family endonuclease NucS